MSKCPMCLAGLPSSCLTGSCEQTEPTIVDESTTEETRSPTQQRIETTNDVSESEDEGRGSRNSGRSRSGGKRSLADSQSSGRKQAAKRYPLNRDAPCEWVNQGNCGGGDYPVLGCLNGLQEARHHGPDKSVQNNEDGNVHRICHYCHYRWHAANNPSYDFNAGIYPPHQPRPLTEKERKSQAIDYMRYLTKTKRKRKKDRIED